MNAGAVAKGAGLVWFLSGNLSFTPADVTERRRGYNSEGVNTPAVAEGTLDHRSVHLSPPSIEQLARAG